MDDKIKEEEKEEIKELPSVRLENLRASLYQMFKYLEQVDVRGSENTKILSGIFRTIIQITNFLEELKEDVMNLEGKEVVKK